VIAAFGLPAKGSRKPVVDGVVLELALLEAHDVTAQLDAASGRVDSVAWIP
jgi:hypothetical protein